MSEQSVAQGAPGTDARLQALKMAISGIEKQWGKGTIMALDDKPIADLPVISTGIPALNTALGVGGLPRGRIIEIFGPESSGKTSLCLHVIAEAHKLGGICAFIDAEHALDVVYAKALGVDPSRLYLSQPDFGEQALTVLESLVNSGAVDVVVVDSVAALTPRSEIEGELGDQTMGVHARMMSQALRKVTSAIGKSQCVVIFTNQLRDIINTGFGSWGPTQTTTGGNALKFYATIRIDIRRIEWIKEGEVIMGSKTKVRVVKNKVAPPFRECLLEVMFGKGFIPLDDTLDEAIKHGVITQKSGWYYFSEFYTGAGPMKLAQGRANAKKVLDENADVKAAVQAKIKQAASQPAIGGGLVVTAGAGDTTAD